MVTEPAPLPSDAVEPDLAADRAFAATVAEEPPELDDADALPPGSTRIDPRTLLALPTLLHVGRYALKHQLGSGGLGTVYAALDPLLSRPIAVKMLRLDEAGAAQRAALEQQLLAEARAAAGLNHPNIVTVFDAGLSDEGVYIAMERLQGRDLRQLMADGWRPDAVQAARIAKRLADALDYAHGHGVVHCDVKPANVFMTGRTQPKLLDFGIARVAAHRFGAPVDIDTDIAGDSTPPELGSPYYAAPEQLRGETLDARADVYGVGVVLYELLAGRRAFAGDDLDAIRAAVLELPVEPVHTVNPDLDAALAGIVARAMARKPADRYRSARHLSRALRGWISDETNGPAAPRASWPARLAAALRDHRRRWVAGGAALVSVMAVGALVALVAGWRLQASPDPGLTSAAPPTPARAAAPATAPEAPPAAPDPAPALAAEPAVVAKAPAPDAPAPVAAKPTLPARPAKAPPKALVAAAPAAPPPVAQPAATGTLQLAVSPWGQVEVNGKPAGTTPPLSRLTLPVGSHQVVVRNDDFPAFTTSITVSEDKPVTLRHRFGS